MKIRVLLAGLVLAVASGCAAEALIPDHPTTGPVFEETPPDTSGRSGGTMGSGD